MEKLTKKEKRAIEKELKRRLHHKIYLRTKSSAIRFKREVKKHIVTAVTAAFAFLIALSWRTPIKNSVDGLVDKLGLNKEAIYLEYFSAIIITIIAVLVIMLVSKWTSEEK
jgi:hypothetical protein